MPRFGILPLHNRPFLAAADSLVRPFCQYELTAITTLLGTAANQASSGHSQSAPRILNHGQFLDHAGRELDRTRKSLTSRFDVLCLEPDCYRATAMSIGNAAADRLAQAAADHISPLLWPRDAIATLDQGRIAVLLDTASVARTTQDFIDDVQRHLMAGFQVDGRQIRTTASIGIARISAGYSRAVGLIDDATAALYRARAEGRARAVKFSRIFDDRTANLNDLESDLRLALEKQQLEIHFQPIVSAETGTLDAFEALLRWRHPSRGLLAPGEFLPSLEDAGLMISVGEWMIREASAHMDSWRDAAGRTIPITVNLTSEQIDSTPVFDALIAATENRSGESPSIIIEVSEDAFLKNRTAIVSVLEPLREHGVRVVLDGFGTGLCCLGYIADLPIDAIKLDASFADSVTRYSDAESAVQEIVELAHRLELDVIAGRIERSDQLFEVIDIGCDDLQGFLVSRPVDAVAAMEMVRNDWTVTLSSLIPIAPIST